MTVIRKGHAFEGQTLAVISSIKRRGVLLVLVILPNAGRSLIPAAWTDWRNADTSLSTDDIDRASSLGKLGDLLQLGKVIDALLSRTPSRRHTWRAAMQLNLAFLDPAQPPSGRPPTSPPPAAWEQLDEAARLAALAVLARLIARMLVDAPARENGHE